VRAIADRGWLFNGAGFGALATDDGAPVGLSVGLSGRIDMVEGDDAVRQAIIMLLTTIPGERVVRPDYGCPLHRLMFAPNDATTAGLAIHYVRQAILRFEPRIDIVSMDAHADEMDSSRLIVSLEYQVRVNGTRALLKFGFDLSGENP